ncbi:MAG: hypothetical protein QGH63_12760 [Rhodospirillales bacterium]|nr:hypothetical protein [Rhodospirillales bacterium]
MTAIIYALTFHNVLEIWCTRIYAPDYLEADTIIMENSTDRMFRRAAYFFTSLDLGLIEISGVRDTANRRAV